VTEEEVQKAAEKLQNKKEIELKTDLAVGPFHYRDTPVETEKQPFCTTCHLSNPHRENERSRSFLNMHTPYISCETCHLKTDELEFHYRWLAYDYPNAGEMIDASLSVHSQVDEVSKSIRVRPGAHIAPFLGSDPVLIFKDDAYVKALEEEWEQASIEQKAHIKVKLHSPLEKEGKACGSCHSEQNSLLDLKLLGATERQSQEIARDKIADLFKRYKDDNDSIRIDDLLR
jgi:hypothetical protein